MDNDIKVVSFDIFDTLLLRTYIKPSDLFKLIEIKEKKEGFFAWRCSIERKLKHKFKREIEFDEIYGNAPDDYKLLKDVELTLEASLLYPNEKIRTIFEQYKINGYKIVAISDMYLSSTFLRKVLEDNGFYGIENIFVSGEYNATKFNSNLFKKALSELKINPHELKHIGDNKFSDYIVPKQLGIKAEHIQKLRTSFFKNHKFIKKYYSLHKYLPQSIIAGEIMKNNCNLNVLEKFGYEVAGPMVLSYTSFVYGKCKESGIDKLLFVARDGYFVKKCFDFFNLDIDNAYVYAPRYQYYLTHYDTDYQTDSSIPRFICSYFNLNVKGNRRKWIRNNRAMIEPLIEKERENDGYNRYIKNVVGSSKKIAIVDGPSGKRTAQKYIQKELGTDILTFYIQVLPRLRYKDFYKKSLLKFPHHYIINRVQRSAFIERIFTSPYNGVKKVSGDGEIQYKNNKPFDDKHKSNYEKVENGMLLFFESMKKYKDVIGIFGNYTVFEDMLYSYTKYNKSNMNIIKATLVQDSWWLYCDK